jgi:hypothetical protein
MATKAKGLPRIIISLDPVAPSARSDVIADFSLALYAAYKSRQEQKATGSSSSCHLRRSISFIASSVPSFLTATRKSSFFLLQNKNK